MRSTRINLLIVSSAAVVGVAGSPATAMSAVPIDQHGHSPSAVVRVPPTVAVDARGHTLGRRVPPLHGNSPAAVPPAASAPTVAVDARGHTLGRRVPPLHGNSPAAVPPAASAPTVAVDARGHTLGRRVPPIVR